MTIPKLLKKIERLERAKLKAECALRLAQWELRRARRRER